MVQKSRVKEEKRKQWIARLTRGTIYTARSIVLIGTISVGFFAWGLTGDVAVAILSGAAAVAFAWPCWRVLYYPFLRLRPNWQAKDRSRRFRYSCHKLSINKTMNEDALNRLSNELYYFKYFNEIHNNSFLVIVDAHYAYFESIGFLGFCSGLINPRLFPVRLTHHPHTRTVVGDTATGHMLVGQRRWIVMPQAFGVDVLTEARERPRDPFNGLGMKWAGKKLQQRIWYCYFENIKDIYDRYATIDDEKPGNPAPLPNVQSGEIAWCPDF